MKVGEEICKFKIKKCIIKWLKSVSISLIIKFSMAIIAITFENNVYER